MSLPLKTGFPPGITLKAGYIVRFRATNPTTGADVGGVKVSGASVFVDGEGTLPLTPTNVLKYVYQAEDGSQVG